ncbi:MAG: type I secretion system permease/ATPase [Proteobacteria bacterium]|nr:type I secretion system permease/ATPase [Pseudomonadota bacterium]
MANTSEERLDGNVLRDALAACRRHFAYVVLFSLALNVLYLAPSLFMLQVYDRVLTSGDVLTLVYLLLVLVISLGTLAFLDATRMRLLAAMAKRFDRLVAPHVLNAALRREGSAAAGQVQLVRELDTLRAAVSGPPALAAIDAPWTPVYIGVCFIIHPWLGVLTLGGGVLLLLIAYINQRASARALKANLQASSAMYALQQADAAQMETARAMGMRKALVSRQLRAREQMSQSMRDQARSGAAYASSTKFFRLLLQSSALGLGVLLALEQQISAGAIIAASILATRAFSPIELIVGAWPQFEQGRQAYAVLKAVLQTEHGARIHTSLPAPKGALSVEGVSVRAPGSDRALLFNAAFRAAPGEIIGVVGPSGAGKSTLLRAIAGAIAPDQGVVRLDGAKLSDWDPDQLGRYVGYLPQDIGLLPGAVADNIARFSRNGDDRSDADIVAAAQAVGAHEMILSLSKGYDTVVGAGGRGLSVGQAQRVALARAFYRNPMLLALDEPNAHLDVDGERALVSALDAARQRGATALVVAHSATLVAVVDKLLVVRDGRIEAFGPRDQIAARLSGAQPRPAVVASSGETVGRS